MDPLTITTAVVTMVGGSSAYKSDRKRYRHHQQCSERGGKHTRCHLKISTALTSILRDALEEREIQAVVNFGDSAQRHVEDLEGPLPIIRLTLEKIVAKLHQHLQPSDKGKEFKLRLQ